MMKPSTPGTGAQSGPNGVVSGSDETMDYFPHIGTLVQCPLSLFAYNSINRTSAHVDNPHPLTEQ